MLEFIGFLVVAFFVWRLFRFLTVVLNKQRLLKACHISAVYGVPEDSALKVVADTQAMINELSLLKKENPEFEKKSVVDQYTDAIAAIYWRQYEENEKIRTHVVDQILKLKELNERVSVNFVVFMYVWALSAVISTGNKLKMSDVKSIVEGLFYTGGEMSRFDIENAYNILLGITNISEYMKELLPIASAEVSSGAGDYLVKYIQKVNKKNDLLFSPEGEDIANDFEPEQVTVKSILAV